MKIRFTNETHETSKALRKVVLLEDSVFDEVWNEVKWGIREPVNNLVHSVAEEEVWKALLPLVHGFPVTTS